MTNQESGFKKNGIYVLRVINKLQRDLLVNLNLDGLADDRSDTAGIIDGIHSLAYALHDLAVLVYNSCGSDITRNSELLNSERRLIVSEYNKTIFVLEEYKADSVFGKYNDTESSELNECLQMLRSFIPDADELIDNLRKERDLFVVSAASVSEEQLAQADTELNALKTPDYEIVLDKPFLVSVSIQDSTDQNAVLEYYILNRDILNENEKLFICQKYLRLKQETAKELEIQNEAKQEAVADLKGKTMQPDPGFNPSPSDYYSEFKRLAKHLQKTIGINKDEDDVDSFINICGYVKSILEKLRNVNSDYIKTGFSGDMVDMIKCISEYKDALLANRGLTEIQTQRVKTLNRFECLNYYYNHHIENPASSADAVNFKLIEKVYQACLIEGLNGFNAEAYLKAFMDAERLCRSKDILLKVRPYVQEYNKPISMVDRAKLITMNSSAVLDAIKRSLGKTSAQILAYSPEYDDLISLW